MITYPKSSPGELKFNISGAGNRTRTAFQAALPINFHPGFSFIPGINKGRAYVKTGSGRARQAAVIVNKANMALLVRVKPDDTQVIFCTHYSTPQFLSPAIRSAKLFTGDCLSNIKPDNFLIFSSSVSIPTRKYS
jgi:hypothetical protein